MTILSIWLWLIIAFGAVASQGVKQGPLRVALGEVLEEVRLDPANCALVTRANTRELSELSRFDLWRCGDAKKVGDAQLVLLSITREQLAFEVTAHAQLAGTRILVEVDTADEMRITFATRSRAPGIPIQPRSARSPSRARDTQRTPGEVPP